MAVKHDLILKRLRLFRMPKISTIILAVLLFETTGKAGDLDRLQGSWNMIRFDNNGKSQAFENGRVIVKRDQFFDTLRYKYDGVIKLNSVDGFNIFEQKEEITNQRTKTDRGIFQLEGDTFRQCSISGNKLTIPEDFSSVKGSHRLLRVWKRLGRTPVNSKNVNDALVGTWQLESETINGAQSDEETTKNSILAVEAGGRFTARFDVTFQWKVKLDESKSPKQIDFEALAPDFARGNIMHGIYRIEENKVLIDRNLSIQPRPTEFGPSNKPTHHLEYERSKP